MQWHSALTWQTGSWALLTIKIALALAVTTHVLLGRRDVGSGVAWIGLAWLVPLLGCLLYWIFGINRIVRRVSAGRAKVRRGRFAPIPTRNAQPRPHDALARAGYRITGRPAVANNTIELLRGGDEAYPQMLASIEAAASSIEMSSYIFRDDRIGSLFVQALARARQRGADVRVLVDGLGGGYLQSPAFHALRTAGVPAARFLHSALPWRMPFLNLRNHRKLLCIDGREAYVGGLNVGDENQASMATQASVSDTHFRLVGTIVSQVVEVFDEDWLFATDKPASRPDGVPHRNRGGECLARVVTSGPDQDLDKLQWLILESIGCATSSIKIMTPYFLPGEVVITALILAAMRGVVVDIALPERSNHVVLDWACRDQVEPLLSAGCNVWTHPMPFDHSKLMAVDGRWCLIGSANWDVRSLRLNFELDVEIYDTKLTTQIAALISSHCRQRMAAAAIQQPSRVLRLRNGLARLMLPYL